MLWYISPSFPHFHRLWNMASHSRGTVTIFNPHCRQVWLGTESALNRKGEKKRAARNLIRTFKQIDGFPSHIFCISLRSLLNKRARVQYQVAHGLNKPVGGGGRIIQSGSQGPSPVVCSVASPPGESGALSPSQHQPHLEQDLRADQILHGRSFQPN